jgi:hypothetical protein
MQELENTDLEVTRFRHVCFTERPGEGDSFEWKARLFSGIEGFRNNTR